MNVDDIYGRLFDWLNMKWVEATAYCQQMI